jgi:hypothetical protein
MKWPIGAGFSMSALPVRLTAQSFSLLPAHPVRQTVLESFSLTEKGRISDTPETGWAPETS